jgi:hypothetical protein
MCCPRQDRREKPAQQHIKGSALVASLQYALPRYKRHTAEGENDINDSLRQSLIFDSPRHIQV